MSIKTITTVFGMLIVLALGYIAYGDAVSIRQNLQDQKQQIHKLNTEQKQLNQELDKTIETKQKSQEEVQRLEKEKQDLEKERQRLESELQAKAETKQRLAEAESKAKLVAASQRVINTATATQTASAAPSSGGARSGCGDNQYAAYIYGQESGGRVTGNCDTTSRNAGGCYGIGQSCPASKIAHCGADYSCQNAWFSQYAISAYGSWAAAYNFHKNNGWW